MTTLGYEAEVHAPLETAVALVTAVLKTEGFGVLTRIDVHAAFKDKLGKEFRPYVILGACNPQLAHAALSLRPELGLLLPCNITVEERAPAECLVRVINPREMMRPGGFDQDPAIAGVGGDAEERLLRVVAALRG